MIVLLTKKFFPACDLLLLSRSFGSQAFVSKPFSGYFPLESCVRWRPRYFHELHLRPTPRVVLSSCLSAKRTTTLLMANMLGVGKYHLYHLLCGVRRRTSEVRIQRLGFRTKSFSLKLPQCLRWPTSSFHLRAPDFSV